jgi:hypothetical protein
MLRGRHDHLDCPRDRPVEPQPGQSLAGRGRQGRQPLERADPGTDRGEHRRLIARAGPDLEDERHVVPNVLSFATEGKEFR